MRIRILEKREKKITSQSWLISPGIAPTGRGMKRRRRRNRNGEVTEIERATVPGRAGRLFLSGTTEIRGGRSNGGRGESSRTWRGERRPGRGATVTGTRKREWKSRERNSCRVTAGIS